MLIQFASDLHLEIPKNNRYFQQEKITPFADILILAGDTMYWDEDYMQIMCIGTIINLLCLMEFKLFFQHYGHTFLLP